MNFDRIYIISYMPDDELRTNRFEIHRRQLEYWKRKVDKIIIFAQNYQQGDFEDGVEYLVNEGPTLLPGSARNKCLEHFYASDADFTAVLDNDIILYEGMKYRDSDNLLPLLRGIELEKFEGIDVFEPINPTQTPFSAYFEKHSVLLDQYLVFNRKVNISGQSVFIRNFKKHYGKEYYYVDWKDPDTGKVVMGEDVEFGIRLVSEGHGVYSLMNAVRKDMGWTVSSWCKNPEARKAAFANLKTILPSLGVGTKSGNLDWAGFADRHSLVRKRLVPKMQSGLDLEDFFT